MLDIQTINNIVQVNFVFRRAWAFQRDKKEDEKVRQSVDFTEGNSSSHRKLE